MYDSKTKPNAVCFAHHEQTNQQHFTHRNESVFVYMLHIEMCVTVFVCMLFIFHNLVCLFGVEYDTTKSKATSNIHRFGWRFERISKSVQNEMWQRCNRIKQNQFSVRAKTYIAMHNRQPACCDIFHSRGVVCLYIHCIVNRAT